NGAKDGFLPRRAPRTRRRILTAESPRHGGTGKAVGRVTPFTLPAASTRFVGLPIPCTRTVFASPRLRGEIPSPCSSPRARRRTLTAEPPRPGGTGKTVGRVTPFHFAGGEHEVFRFAYLLYPRRLRVPATPR